MSAVLYGPTKYIPLPNEWCHNFVWHGSSKENKTKKVYGMLNFTKLRVMADQMYLNVRRS